MEELSAANRSGHSVFWTGQADPSLSGWRGRMLCTGEDNDAVLLRPLTCDYPPNAGAYCAFSAEEIR